MLRKVAILKPSNVWKFKLIKELSFGFLFHCPTTDSLDLITKLRSTLFLDHPVCIHMVSILTNSLSYNSHYFLHNLHYYLEGIILLICSK